MRNAFWLPALLFMIMCLIWGATWIAVKEGLAEIPPAAFVGTRFLAAGALLLSYQLVFAGSIKIRLEDVPRLFSAMLLLVVVTYPLLFWGMLYVSSALAAVIDLSFLPVALLAFAIALGEERFSAQRSLAVALGVVGLGFLFGPKVGDSSGASLSELWGGGAIVLSALLYAAGSVIARPLLRLYPATLISGLTLFMGGVIITLAAVWFEEGAKAALEFQWSGLVWASWLFLVFGGSIGAHTIYLQLVRDWGPSRAGAYCFVTPVIAVFLGVVVRGEQLGFAELIGITVMLVAAGLAVRQEQTSNLPRGPAVEAQRAS